MEELITEYFQKGYTYLEICKFLEQRHGKKISLRTLKNRLKKIGLSRRPHNDEDVMSVINAVSEHIELNGSTHGYRHIWHKLRSSGMNISRDLVMMTLRELDPEGVSARKARKLKRRKYSSDGPNDIWHVDGYDKLKPYGFPIHGCIDGYSRRIIWLQYVKSNNNPFTVGKLYLDVVQSAKIVPRRVRADCGSENIFIAASQCYFRRNDEDEHAGEKSHLYGSSHHNQRIEAWWSQLRRIKSDFMINFFREMVNKGELNVEDDLEKACVQYCFGPLLQSELNHCKDLWNSHYIRKSDRTECYGRPDALYYLHSDTYPDKDVNVTSSDLDIMTEHLSEYSGEDNENDENIFVDYFDYLSSEFNIEAPSDFHAARANYLRFLSFSL